MIFKRAVVLLFFALTVVFNPVLAMAAQPKIAAGLGHSIIIKDDGTLRAWGSNDKGQLGDGTNTNRDFPVAVSGLSGVIAVAAGWQHSVALLSDGTVWCWGVNDKGQLGDGSTASSNVPVMVQSASGIISIAAGRDFTLALKSDGTVLAWGENSQGQLGNGGTDNALSPVLVSISDVAEIAAGVYHSYALKNDATAWTWGAKMHEPLVPDDMVNLVPVPLNKWSDRLVREVRQVQIPGTGEQVDVISSVSHTVIAKNSGEVFTAGAGMGDLDKGGADPSQMVLVEWSGGVKVDITPEGAVSADAKWRVDGGQWRLSGESQSGLSVGDHTIEFLEPSGWIAPATQAVSVTEGQLTVVSGVYNAKTASITVNLGPSDVNGAGAKWRVNGGPWMDGGASVADVSIGTHTIEFVDLIGWNNPGVKSVNLGEGGLTVAFNYTVDESGGSGSSGGDQGSGGGQADGGSGGGDSGGDVAVSTPVDVGSPVSGLVGDGGYYSFNTNAGARYMVEIGASAGVTVSVYSTDEATLLGTYSSSFSWVAPSAGTYYIKIESADPAASGEFTLALFARSKYMDFNSDGKADMLWRHEMSGNTSIWLMSGGDILSSGDTSASAGDPGGWKIKGLGDFSGDGMTDILWRHAGSGKTAIWFMNGRVLTGGTGLTSVQIPASSAWRIKSVDDFDGDGRTDILWRHGDTGKTAIWFLDGLELTGKSALTSVQVSAGSMWEIEDTGDFDGDGRADILWRHAGSGLTAIWFMDGVTMLDGSALTTLQVEGGANGWAVRDVGDFNGDGRADILWRHSTKGQTYIWFMNGVEVSPASGYTSTIVGAGSPWRIAGVGDYNGDGRADILWQRADTGATFLWIMDGLSLTGGSKKVSDSGGCPDHGGCYPVFDGGE